MSHSNTPKTTTDIASRINDINIDELFCEMKAKQLKRIYLLCIHCMDGVCISYKGDRTISSIIDVDPMIDNIETITDVDFPFFLTSCRMCMNYQLVEVEYDSPSISEIVLRNQQRVLQLCLHERIITSSDMYTAIVKTHKVSPEPMCYNHGLIYVNSQSLFNKLDSDSTIISYIARHQSFSTTMHGGFF